MTDQRPGPSHYQTGDVQPIDLIHSAGLDFDEGNVIKYVTRWRRKDGLTDLYKARTYLNWIIERAEEEKRSSSQPAPAP